MGLYLLSRILVFIVNKYLVGDIIMDKQKIIYESINEAKDSMSLSLKMFGSFLDYVAYNFLDSIKLMVVDNLYNLTNKAMDIINFSNKFSVFKEKGNIHFAFWTSSYGFIAEIDNNGGCSFNRGDVMIVK